MWCIFVLCDYMCNLVFELGNTFKNAKSRTYINFKKLIHLLLLLEMWSESEMDHHPKRKPDKDW